MRLKQIRLAGFKSFADQSNIYLNTSVLAIVGPNGCGKSNIVDAIRWVIGESSARSLRGDVITDLIFDGADTRRESSRASAELLFDNKDGRFGGEYAAYSEISLRREVSIDQQSIYYLNNHRCRRRDIQDLFLGTGFGTRGYAIIEQGLVGQLVESRPEDLRQHLEEAAGVSKYRARRHETELKINHTHSNLERLEDQLVELKRQINLLNRQARAAERSQMLNARLREQQAVLFLFQKQDYQAHLQAHEERLKEHDDETRKLELDKNDYETGLLRLETEQSTAVEHRDELQRDMYEIGAQINNAESELRANEERIKDQKQVQDSLLQRVQILETQHLGDGEEVERLVSKMNGMESTEKQQAADLDASKQLALDAEEKYSLTQTRWEKANERRAVLEQSLAKFRADADYSIKYRENLSAQLGRYELENEEVQSQGSRLAELQNQVEVLNERNAKTERDLAHATETVTRLERELVALDSEVNVQQRQDQALREEASALRALQEAAYGRAEQTPEVQQWLLRHNLNEVPRLGENLVVERGWEHAVETILSTDMQALVIESVESLGKDAAELLTGGISGVEPFQGEADVFELDPLADRVRSDQTTALALLNGIFTATSLEEALRSRSRLASYQSIVMQDGTWMGKFWYRKPGDLGEIDGVLARAARLKEHIELLDKHEATLRVSKGNQVAKQAEIAESIAHRDRLIQQKNSIAADYVAQQTAMENERNRQVELTKRIQKLEVDRLQIQQSFEEEQKNFKTLSGELSELTARESEIVTLCETLNAARESSLKEFRKYQDLHATKHDSYHRLQLDINQLKSDVDNLRLTRERQVETMATLTLERDQVNSIIGGLERGLPSSRARRSELLDRQLSLEDELKKAQLNVRSLDTKIEQKTVTIQQKLDEIDDLKTRRSEVSVQIAELRTELRHITDQIERLGVSLAKVEPQLDDVLSEEAVQSEIDKIEKQLSRLGDINQRAIREFEERNAERQRLDEQVQDLVEALEILRAAIRKIDQETRNRLNETFARVNKNLAEIFPKLFGGGIAKLEMTGDSVLDAGVIMRAVPPGKRDMSVNLLSGGEKALAALAFIFAVFRLNPSPVCILDEVDAPLDETNIARYTELIREMSLETQFIMITHNTGTMERADELLGVTMEEKGVSRIVSVNLADAMAWGSA